MRPIKLTISAFGPYAGNVEIDFEKFLEKGIYLISGNTGAGKSTIFEAIKFALYGEDNGEIRSKYAEAEVATFVDMTFALRGKEYKIKRNTKYNRPKSRGEGSTLAKAEAELIFPDGRVVSGYSNVTKEIIIPTGLNSEQFSKIVMIAQGKFRELLEADTANRSKIFRDIFKTEPYDKIQRKVKTKYLEAYKENSKTTDSIKQFVQGIIINDDFCKKNHLENIMNQDMIADIDEVLELTAMLISEDEISYKNNLAKMEEGQNEINKLNGLLSVTSNNLKNLKGLEEELIKLSNYEEDYKTVLLAYEKENDLKEQREKLYVSIENLKKTVEILQTMESDGTDEVIPNQKRYEALYRGRRAMVLAILGRFEEAEKELEEVFKLPLCESCNYCSCKDAEIFRANIEEVRGNWAKALELHCSGSERWPDDLDFVSGIRRMKRKDLGL